MADELKAGMTVKFKKPVDLYPTDFINQGERALIRHVSSDGVVEVLLERYHRGVEGNTLYAIPWYDDGLLEALEPVPSGLPVVRVA